MPERRNGSPGLPLERMPPCASFAAARGARPGALRGRGLSRTIGIAKSGARLMRASVVICSIDAAKFARVTAGFTRVFGDALAEIVGVHDARSLAEGYNRGIDRVRGDVVVFCHDDIELVAPDFADRVRRHLESFDLVGIAGTRRLVGGAWHLAGHPHDFMLVVSPHPDTGQPVMIVGGAGPLFVPDIQALDGVFMVTRVAVARRLRFDADTFDGFHHYDLDFSFRAFGAGLRLAVCRDLVLLHQSSGRYDERWERYRVLFERKHAARLAPMPPRRQNPPIVNVPLDAATLANPDEAERLCRPETLLRFLAQVARIPRA